MITKKDLATNIILTIITCGIYGLVWLYNIVNDVKTVSNDTSLPTAGMVVFLSIITCGIYSFYAYYKIGKLLQIAKQNRNMPPEDNSVIYLVLAIVGFSIISEALIQNELNEMAQPPVAPTPNAPVQ